MGKSKNNLTSEGCVRIRRRSFNSFNRRFHNILRLVLSEDELAHFLRCENTFAKSGINEGERGEFL